MIWIYKQLKDLPNHPAGSIWEIKTDVGNRTIKVDGVITSSCEPSIDKQIVKYYTNENGMLDMEGDFFALANDEDERKLMKQIQIQQLMEERDYYQSKLLSIENALEEMLQIPDNVGYYCQYYRKKDC